jgi:hypothetical protein
MKPPALTVRALRAGSAFALALFLSAIVLNLLGNDIAERAGLLGVVAIIATPAIALLATAVEQWVRDRSISLLALAVVGVLTVASAIALFGPR